MDMQAYFSIVEWKTYFTDPTRWFIGMAVLIIASQVIIFHLLNLLYSVFSSGWARHHPVLRQILMVFVVSAYLAVVVTAFVPPLEWPDLVQNRSDEKTKIIGTEPEDPKEPRQDRMLPFSTPKLMSPQSKKYPHSCDHSAVKFTLPMRGDVYDFEQVQNPRGTNCSVYGELSGGEV